MVRMGELLESFFSMVGERLLDYGLDSAVRNINDICLKLEKNSKSLIAKAYDVEEQLKNGEQSHIKKRKREVENWLEEVKKIESEFLTLQDEVQEEGFISHFLFGDRAVKLNAKVEGFLEQSQHFGELLLDVCESRQEPLLTTMMFGEEFHKNLDRISRCLVVERVPIIGIYGMGGVGKTTLAKHINKQILSETQFCVYWVTVSQEFSIKKLQDDIAKVVGLTLSNENEEDKRAATLNQTLSQMKDFILILDDVWEDIDLEKLGYPLHGENCRLIITTRSLELCHRIGCQEKFEVKTLNEDEAWSLFEVTLGHFMKLTPQIQEIAKLVAKECNGLPLGIVTLARSMRGVTNICEWRNALTELQGSFIVQLSDMKKVFVVLRYSFNKLDPILQSCFLYCSLYPEDCKIKKHELINRFISEKLVDKRKRIEENFDLGHAILNKLVNLCLLESGRVENVEYVKMHDLVRDMARKIARDNLRFKIFSGLSLKEIPNEEEWTEDVEKMSLMSNKIREISPGKAPNCPKLSTLLLNINPLEFIPESFFLQIRGIRILDLSSTSIKELPNSLSDLERLDTLILRLCKNLVSVPYLGKLKALRELDLSWTSIKVLPNSLSDLKSLNTLLLCHCQNLVSIPYLGKLKALRQLDLSWTSIKELPNSLSDLESLNTLLLCYCQKLVSIPYLGKLKALRELNLSWTSIKELPNSLSDLGSLEMLILRQYGNLVSVPYLGNLTALRKLDLSHTSIQKMPQGMENLVNLQSLLFGGTKDLKLLPGDLSLISPYLQHLILSHRIETPVQEIVQFKQLNEFVGRFKDVSDFNDFIKSQTGGLILKYCYSVGTVSDVEDAYSEDTKKVTIHGCSFRKREGEDRVIILPGNIQQLKILECEGLSSCFLDDFKCPSSLQSLRISGCNGIQSILSTNDQLMAEESNSIEYIYLTSLPNFKGLINWEVGAFPAPPPPQATMIFSSLKYLYIYKCNKMKTLGLPLPYLQNMERITVVNCDEIEEMIQVTDDQEISGGILSLPNLKNLYLTLLPKLKHICKIRIDCNSIERIELWYCPIVKNIPLFLPPSCGSSLNGQLIYSPPPALQRINIHKDLWESLEWEDLTHKHLLRPFVHHASLFPMEII